MTGQPPAGVVDPDTRHSRPGNPGEPVRGPIVGRLGHELRGPLTGIVGLARIMRADLGAGRADPDRQRRQLELISSSAAELLRTVELVVELANLDSAPEMPAEEFDCGAAVGAAATGFDRTVQEHGVRLVVDLPDHPVTALGSGSGLRRILAELIDNAIKYADGAEVRIRLGATDRHVLVDVTDLGPGLPAGESSGIFAPFVRGGAAERTGVAGSGLGLHLARRLADRMAAGLHVRSDAPDNSTTFTVRLKRSAGE